MRKLGLEKEAAALGTDSIPALKNEAIELTDEVEALFNQPTDLEKMIAYQKLRQLAEQGKIDRAQIESLQRQIAADAAELSELLAVKQAA